MSIFIPIALLINVACFVAGVVLSGVVIRWLNKRATK